MGWHGLDRSGSGQGPVEGSCEHGNEHSGSIKWWEVLEQLHNWQLSSVNRYRRMVGWQMNDELARILKEEVATQSS
jgi:hypothetical protein